jgi:hypothetical protein
MALNPASFARSAVNALIVPTICKGFSKANAFLHGLDREISCQEVLPFSTLIKVTLKIKVSFGPITGGAPRSP